MEKQINRGRNFARKTIVKLLVAIETMNEFRTGKRCNASANFCLNIGIGYHRTVGEYGMTEFYLMPFTRVSIFTPFIGMTMENETTNI